ncbi:MAG: DNA-formamidopyrimidine glycosylase family protein [Actinomycetota bacterium]
MPEILEVEMYRRGAEPVVGRTIAEVDAPDDWYVKGVAPDDLIGALTGARIEGTRRIGKLMLLDTSTEVLGLRYGMTGRLIVDEHAVIDALEYSSKRLDPAWIRFRLTFEEGGTLVMNDPRRLGGISLAPDTSDLGPDAWTIGLSEFREITAASRGAIKALLLNQKRIAGLGNLLADELCWRTGVDPRRPSNEVAPDTVERVWEHLTPMLDELYRRGGSHLGDHVEARAGDALCPADGGQMAHDTVGGRSTWWCPEHQV